MQIKIWLDVYKANQVSVLVAVTSTRLMLRGEYQFPRLRGKVKAEVPIRVQGQLS